MSALLIILVFVGATIWLGFTHNPTYAPSLQEVVQKSLRVPLTWVDCGKGCKVAINSADGSPTGWYIFDGTEIVATMTVQPSAHTLPSEVEKVVTALLGRKAWGSWFVPVWRSQLPEEGIHASNWFGNTEVTLTFSPSNNLFAVWIATP